MERMLNAGTARIAGIGRPVLRGSPACLVLGYDLSVGDTDRGVVAERGAVLPIMLEPDLFGTGITPCP